MNKLSILALFFFSILLAGCGVEEECISGCEPPDFSEFDEVEVNVAKAAFGVSLTTTTRPGDAGKLIDGDTSTYWESDPEVPIVVELGRLEEVMEFTLLYVDVGSITGGTNSDLIVDVSTDGINFSRTDLAAYGGGEIDCGSDSYSTTRAFCSFRQHWDGQEISHLRITTSNSKAYKFTDLEVIAIRIKKESTS